MRFRDLHHAGTEFFQTPLAMIARRHEIQHISAVLIHLDADAFYVSVEQAARPELRGKMVAVGGLHRGIIASASYEARKMGVYTPMPTVQARKLCPGLILVRGNMENYSRVSRKMFAIIDDFTPLVERTSIDEGYFDVGGHRTLTPRAIGEQIKARVRAELDITVSLGIGANKLVAQIASKLRKPDALVEVPRGGEREFIAPLDVQWLPGVGAKLGAHLREFGLRQVRDVAQAPRDLLAQAAGSYAEQLQAYANGLDDRELAIEHEDAKSYGIQDTFGENVSDREALLATLRGMADDLMSRVRADAKTIRTVSVKVRYPEFRDTSHAITLDLPTDLETDIYPHLPALLRGAWKEQRPLRLISLRFSNVGEPSVQSELALGPDAKRRARQHDAARVLDELRARDLPVTRGHTLR